MEPNLDAKPIPGTNRSGNRFVGHLLQRRSVSLRRLIMRLVCLLFPLLYYCPICVSTLVTCTLLSPPPRYRHHTGGLLFSLYRIIH
jgi:hypothetical protein